MSHDPMDKRELAFTYEKNLKVIPTAATVLASAMGRPARGEGQVEQKPGHRPSQINFLMVVHGEQKVELHKTLPTSGTFTAQGRSEERRVGQEWVRKCISRWSPYNSKKNKNN